MGGRIKNEMKCRGEMQRWNVVVKCRGEMQRWNVEIKCRGEM